MLFILADDDAEITVSVLLDGEETNMDFLDIPFEEVSCTKLIFSCSNIINHKYALKWFDAFYATACILQYKFWG